MDSDAIFSFANSHLAVIKDIQPFNLILIFSIIFSSSFLFLGKEYYFLTYFIILQSLIILLVHQINSKTINSIFNAIIYTILIILYLFIIFFGVILYNNSNNFNIFIKFASLLYILLFTQPTNNENVFTSQIIIMFLIIVYSTMIIYDYFITNSLNREE